MAGSRFPGSRVVAFDHLPRDPIGFQWFCWPSAIRLQLRGQPRNCPSRRTHRIPLERILADTTDHETGICPAVRQYARGVLDRPVLRWLHRVAGLLRSQSISPRPAEGLGSSAKHGLGLANSHSCSERSCPPRLRLRTNLMHNSKLLAKLLRIFHNEGYANKFNHLEE